MYMLVFLGKLAAWLDDNLEKYGFYRPYKDYKGGVAPEPWQRLSAKQPANFEAMHFK